MAIRRASITFRVLTPSGTPPDAEIWISGNVPELGDWTVRGLRMERDGRDAFVAERSFEIGETLEFKVHRGSWNTVEKSASGREVPDRRHPVTGEASLEIRVEQWRDQVAEPPPHAHTLSSLMRLHPAVTSRHLDHARDVIVYLPPGYAEEPERRYPVLYMHDGQNLFDEATAFLGVEWGLDESANRLIREGRIEPLVIVGIYNSPARIDEYTEVPDPMRGGGSGQAYARFVVGELKPFIDATYRTRPGRHDTGVAGASLGGLVSLTMALRHPGIFSKVGCLSPSVWWGGGLILARVREVPKPSSLVWLDVGTRESGSPARSRRIVANVRALREALVERGFSPGRDLSYVEAPGGRHDEASWGSRAPALLEFLFPPVAGSAPPSPRL